MKITQKHAKSSNLEKRFKTWANLELFSSQLRNCYRKAPTSISTIFIVRSRILLLLQAWNEFAPTWCILLCLIEYNSLRSVSGLTCMIAKKIAAQVWFNFSFCLSNNEDNGPDFLRRTLLTYSESHTRIFRILFTPNMSFMKVEDDQRGFALPRSNQPYESPVLFWHRYFFPQFICKTLTRHPMIRLWMIQHGSDCTIAERISQTRAKFFQLEGIEDASKFSQN